MQRSHKYLVSMFDRNCLFNSASRPKDRADRCPALLSHSTSRPAVASPPATVTPRPATCSPRKSHPNPHIFASRPEADPEEFSRRLKISEPSSRIAQGLKTHHPKLFNPDTDPIPMRHTAEPENISDT